MESDLYKIEPADCCEDDLGENSEKLPMDWELAIPGIDMTWRSEIPDTGENGNCFASGTFGRRLKSEEAS